MKEHKLSRSEAKLYLDGLEHMAQTEGQADFNRGYDDGEAQTTPDFNHYNKQ